MEKGEQKGGRETGAERQRQTDEEIEIVIETEIQRDRYTETERT